MSLLVKRADFHFGFQHGLSHRLFQLLICTFYIKEVLENTAHMFGRETLFQ